MECTLCTLAGVRSILYSNRWRRKNGFLLIEFCVVSLLVSLAACSAGPEEFYSSNKLYKMSIHIKDSDDLKNRLTEAGEKLVVIDFMATWCGPCKMIGPKLDEMANEMADSVVVLKVDVDECEDIATEYNINSMPTFVFVKSNKKLEEFSGANVDKLRNTIIKHK